MQVATYQFQGRRQVGPISAVGSTVRAHAIDDRAPDLQVHRGADARFMTEVLRRIGQTQ